MEQTEMAEHSGSSYDSVSEKETIVVALRNYIKNEGNPWEICLRKGDLMKLVESSDQQWWKVETNNYQGFVPAEYLMKVNLTMTHSNVTSGTGIDSCENDNERREKATRENSKSAETFAGTTNNVGLDSQGLRAEISRLKPNCCVSRKKRKFGGPRDIVKAKGLDKIAVLVPKQEKVEPQDAESDSDPRVDGSVSSDFELQTNNVVRKEPDLEDTLAMSLEPLQTPLLDAHAGDVKPIVVVSHMEQVLTHSELLERILANLKDDIDTLKRVRLVHPFWKICAYTAFKKNPCLLPTVVTGVNWRDSKFESFVKGWGCKFSSLKFFREFVKPSSGFPIKIVIFSCTPYVMKFLGDYAGDIFYLKMVCLNRRKFNPQQAVAPLPALENATFIGRQLISPDMEFSMWKTLIGNGNHLKTYFEDLHYCPNRKPRVGRFAGVSFFDKLATDQHFSQLQILKLNVYPIKSHKLLYIASRSLCKGTQPLSQCFPSGSRLGVQNVSYRTESDNITNSLVNDNIVFEKVVEMTITPPFLIPEVENVETFMKAVTFFPKLTKLRWESSGNLRDLCSSVRIVFAKLEHLQVFELLVCRWDRYDITELLTGVSYKDFSQGTADFSLEEEKRPCNTICNLKKLTSFKLVSRHTDIDCNHFESKILFYAAFNWMDALKQIALYRITFAAEYIKEWEQAQSGRTVQFDSSWTTTGCHYE